MSREEVPDIENRIIEAAKQVFVKKGYEATKMGDIAAEVGISRTAMHYYFRTKEMLFDAIFGQLMDALLPNIGLIMDEESTCLEKIPRIVDEYMAMIRVNPLFPVFVINEFNRDPEHVYRALMKNPARIQPIIRLQNQMLEEMEKGLLKKTPLIYTASTLLSLVIFPMLVRHPLTTVFLEGDPEKFEAFIVERTSFVKAIMIDLLTPGKGKNSNL